MTLLLLISLPFAALSYFIPPGPTIAVPFVLWIGFAWLEKFGILSGATSLGSALLAGGVGATFAVTGFGLARQRRRSPAARPGDTGGRQGTTSSGRYP